MEQNWQNRGFQYRVLKFRGMYGVNFHLNNNLCYTPNFDFSQTEYSNYNVITYVCGHAVVFKNPVTGIDRVESVGGTEVTGITNLNFFPEEKLLVVGFQSKKTPFINFYDISSRPLRKRVQLSVQELGSDQFVGFEKSNDGEFFVALGGSPDYKLIVWSFDGLKTKFFTSITTTSDEHDPVTKCSISPDSKYVCVSGNGIFKIFRINKKDKKLDLVTSHLRDNFTKENFLCHSWLSDPTKNNVISAPTSTTNASIDSSKDMNRLIVINDLGNIFLVENNILKTKLLYSPDDQLNIYAIVETSSGFICGGEKGIIHVYDQAKEEGVLFKRKKVLKIGAGDDISSSDSSNNDNDRVSRNVDNSVRHMAYDINTGVLSVLTDRGNLSRIKIDETSRSSDTKILTQENINKKVDDHVDDENDEIITDFETLLDYHQGGIMDVDTCIQKPFIVTCGTDKTVRILDFMTNHVVTKKFKQDCLSVAIHPTGFYLLIGFSDYLKFFKVLGDEIREHTSFHIRNCGEVQFSSRGQYFAAVYGTVINVYSTYQLTHLHSLRGHNGRVRSICWKDQDTRIVSADINGTVIDFDILTESKVDENSAAKTSFTSVVASSDMVYASGTDGNIHVISKGIPQENCPTGIHIPTTLAVSEKLGQLFAGLDDGSICVYDTSQEELDDYDDRFFVHSGEITTLRLSFDDTLLFSISSDGSLCVFEVKSSKQGKIVERIKYSNEILISKLDLEEKNNIINQLKAKYRELKADNDYDRKKKEMDFANKIKEQQNKFQFELKERDEQIKQLENDLQNKNRKFIQELKEDELQFKKEVEELDKGLQQQITSTLNQLKQMTMTKKNEVDAKKQKMDKKRELFDQRKLKMVTGHVEMMKKKREELKVIEEQIENERLIHEETMKQTREDHESLVAKITKNYEDLLKKARVKNLKLSGENTIKENNEKEHEKLIKNLQNDKDELVAKIKKEDIQLKKKNEEIKVVMAENTERENTIVDKEKKIFELKKQNQELEKHKFVLDHKINSLTEQIKPTKDQISKMRKSLKKKGLELEKSKERNEKLLECRAVLDRKIAQLTKKIKKLRQKVRQNEYSKETVEKKIVEMVRHIQDPKVLRKKFISFYKQHSNQTSVSVMTVDRDIKEEAERQEKYLEMTVESLKKKLAKTTNSAKRENMKIMQENVMLINEINLLRNDAKVQKSKLREAEDRIAIGLNKKKGRKRTSMQDEDERLMMDENNKKAQQLQRQIDLNKIEIDNMRQSIKRLEMEKRARSRPVSKGTLPPLK